VAAVRPPAPTTVGSRRRRGRREQSGFRWGRAALRRWRRNGGPACSRAKSAAGAAPGRGATLPLPRQRCRRDPDGGAAVSRMPLEAPRGERARRAGRPAHRCCSPLTQSVLRQSHRNVVDLLSPNPGTHVLRQGTRAKDDPTIPRRIRLRVSVYIFSDADQTTPCWSRVVIVFENRITIKNQYSIIPCS